MLLKKESFIMEQFFSNSIDYNLIIWDSFIHKFEPQRGE